MSKNGRGRGLEGSRNVNSKEVAANHLRVQVNNDCVSGWSVRTWSVKAGAPRVRGPDPASWQPAPGGGLRCPFHYISLGVLLLLDYTVQ